ncbi:NAD(P)H binding domain of trans-2-enoyl-CoA reductase protein [Bordetella bronchiseptica D993]|nr:NAD(P)H binding domain of trans-2-enoyl-CoA reductase protein [Bordetella bronchiseptica D993]
MDLQLAGKRVLITGASKGIGLACALSFAQIADWFKSQYPAP